MVSVENVRWLTRRRWFWRMSPGVWFTEAYFTENVSPTSHLYMTELAAETVGFTLGQYGLDIG